MSGGFQLKAREQRLDTASRSSPPLLCWVRLVFVALVCSGGVSSWISPFSVEPFPSLSLQISLFHFFFWLVHFVGEEVELELEVWEPLRLQGQQSQHKTPAETANRAYLFLPPLLQVLNPFLEIKTSHAFSSFKVWQCLLEEGVLAQLSSPRILPSRDQSCELRSLKGEEHHLVRVEGSNSGHESSVQIPLRDPHLPFFVGFSLFTLLWYARKVFLLGSLPPRLNLFHRCPYRSPFSIFFFGWFIL